MSHTPPDLPDLPLARYAQLACPHCGVIPAWPAALTALRAYAALADTLAYFPDITSAYRCPWYNATLPGAALNSTHLAGAGLDVAATADTAPRIIAAAVRAGFTTTDEHPERGYVHLDTR